MQRLLLVGQSIELALPVLDLFRRAGFMIDFMSPSKRLLGHPAIARYWQIPRIEQLPEQLSKHVLGQSYDRIILTDDVSLSLVKQAVLPELIKLQLLPVTSLDACSHLASKIGLSECFTAFDIRTPKYRVIEHASDLPQACQALGYPVLLKGDRSGGGTQVMKLCDDADLQKTLREFTYFPAVLQSYIEGALIGIEAYYQSESLIFFNYARVLSNVDSQEFTPSIFREYIDNDSLSQELYQDLVRLGPALKADGFVNITALYDPTTQEHYYVEADMRPTVWVDHAKYWGKDDALAIRQGAANRNALTFLSCKVSKPIRIAYPVRLPAWALLFNRGLAWRQIRNEPYLFKLIVRNYRHRLLAYLNLRALRQWLKRTWMISSH